MILRTFMADLSRLGVELTAAGEAGDQEAYQRAAHAIAGTAAGIGARGLEREARIAMDRHQPEPIGAVMPRIQAEMSGVLAALLEILD